MSGTREKTNVMRLLEAADIEFEVLSYEVNESDLSALHAAKSLGLDPNRVFKTIVLVGERTGPFVCVIPGSCEIDLKKAAKAAKDKSASLLPLRELEGLTGYIRGGCSPLGMKHALATFFDETILLFDTISVSAGRRGLQIFLRPQDLIGMCGAGLADLIA
ncbi:MAG: Cys-tRNA(Pro) deacylase [Spirochaetes bacterium]|nr:Cys-tRNA(Pro) deacylase [Spirochaetota bacterium]